MLSTVVGLLGGETWMGGRGGGLNTLPNILQ